MSDPASSDSQADANSDPLERGVETLSRFASNYLATFTLLARYPSQVRQLLAPETKGKHVGPIPFFLIAYLIVVSTSAIMIEFSNARPRDASFEGFYHQLTAKLPLIDASPSAIMLASLPTLALLSVLARLLAWVTKIRRPLATALLAYSVGYIWLVLALYIFCMLLLIVALLNGPRVLLSSPFFEVIAVAFGVVMAFSITRLVHHLGRFVAEGLSGWRRVFTDVTVTLVCVISGILLSSILNLLAVDEDRTRLDIQVLQIRLGDPPGNSPTLAEEGRPRPYVRSNLTSPDSSTPDLPIQLTVLLRNTGDEPYVLTRELRMPWPQLVLGIPQYKSSAKADTLKFAQEIRVRTLEWSDANSPVLIVKPGEVKWIRFVGAIRSQSPAHLSGAAFQLSLPTENDRWARSSWYLYWFYDCRLVCPPFR